jgi:hypothetical protein
LKSFLRFSDIAFKYHNCHSIIIRLYYRPIPGIARAPGLTFDSFFLVVPPRVTVWFPTFFLLMNSTTPLAVLPFCLAAVFIYFSP